MAIHSGHHAVGDQEVDLASVIGKKLEGAFAAGSLEDTKSGIEQSALHGVARGSMIPVARRTSCSHSGCSQRLGDGERARQKRIGDRTAQPCRPAKAAQLECPSNSRQARLARRNAFVLEQQQAIGRMVEERAEKIGIEVGEGFGSELSGYTHGGPNLPYLVRLRDR